MKKVIKSSMAAANKKIGNRAGEVLSKRVGEVLHSLI